MFAPLRLNQKCFRISLVRAIDKLSLFINKHKILLDDYKVRPELNKHKNI